MVLCGLDPATHTEADLPEVHHEVAKNKKNMSQDADVITAAIQARAIESACLANEFTVPVITMELIKAFREMRTFGTAEQVRGGLSPAGVITIREPGHDTYKEKTRILSLLEHGAVSVSMADTAEMQINDSKLPGRVIVVVRHGPVSWMSSWAQPMPLQRRPKRRLPMWWSSSRT
jgi:hypothetical protein